MKTKLAYIIIIIGLFANCTNDPSWGDCAQMIEYQEEILTKQHSANLTVTFEGDIADAISEVVLEFSKEESFSNAQLTPMNYLNRQATIEINNLDSDATYYVRYLVEPEYLQPVRTSSFQTIYYKLPTATTISATDITPVSAKLSGSADKSDSYEIIDKGIIYTLVLNDSTWNNRLSCQSVDNVVFTALAENLRAGATYYFFAYATNRIGTAYGDTLTFTTPKTY